MSLRRSKKKTENSSKEEIKNEKETAENTQNNEEKKTEEAPQNRSIVMQLTADRLFSSLITIISADILYVVLLFGAFLFDKQMEVNGMLRDFGRFEFKSNELSVFDVKGMEHVFYTGNLVTFMLFSLAALCRALRSRRASPASATMLLPTATILQASRSPKV